MAEMKSFVVVVSFLILSGFVLGFLPTSIFTPSVIGSVPPESNFNPSVLAGYAVTDTFKANTTEFDGLPYSGALTRRYTLNEIPFLMASYVDFAQFRIGVQTYFLFIPWGVEWGSWQHISTGTPRGEVLTIEAIQDDYESSGLPVRYRVTTIQGASDILFSWNTSAYSTVALAVASSELWILHGAGINNTIGSINALSMLLSILTFRAPNINPVINIFIAVPIYAAVGWLLLSLYEKLNPIG